MTTEIGINSDIQLLHQVSRFLFREAELLDSKDFGGWLDLFDEDSLYWLPSSREQTDTKRQVSIICEDKPVLKMRVDRLKNPQSQIASSLMGTVHFISNIWIDELAEDSDLVKVYSCIALSEASGNGDVLLTGHMTHHLRPLGGSFLIRLKRVDLAGAGGILNPINCPI